MKSIVKQFFAIAKKYLTIKIPAALSRESGWSDNDGSGQIRRVDNLAHDLTLDREVAELRKDGNSTAFGHIHNRIAPELDVEPLFGQLLSSLLGNQDCNVFSKSDSLSDYGDVQRQSCSLRPNKLLFDFGWGLRQRDAHRELMTFRRPLRWIGMVAR